MPDTPISVINAIGNTPLIELRSILPSSGCRIVAKMESANPTGSMKDRMAKAVIEGADKKGFIKRGDTIVEYTAGTTEISLAFECTALE